MSGETVKPKGRGYADFHRKISIIAFCKCFATTIACVKHLKKACVDDGFDMPIPLPYTGEKGI
jgi:hypothetical protein